MMYLRRATFGENEYSPLQVKLSRLCEQDKILQDLETRIRTLKEDKVLIGQDLKKDVALFDDAAGFSLGLMWLRR